MLGIVRLCPNFPRAPQSMFFPSVEVRMFSAVGSCLSLGDMVIDSPWLSLSLCGLCVSYIIYLLSDLSSEGWAERYLGHEFETSVSLPANDNLRSGLAISFCFGRVASPQPAQSRCALKPVLYGTRDRNRVLFRSCSGWHLGKYCFYPTVDSLCTRLSRCSANHL